MKLTFNIFIFGLLAILSAGLPAVLMKQYNITKNFNLIIISILSFSLCVYTYYKLFNPENDISIIYPILHLILLLSVALIGIFLFNEELTLDKIIGLGLGIIAVYFLIISDSTQI